uniref:Putative secreted protein n=1 Tax=Ixodes ricinus TaxID=34613 RepID=A0A6B0V197_IXORI
MLVMYLYSASTILCCVVEAGVASTMQQHCCESTWLREHASHSHALTQLCRAQIRLLLLQGWWCPSERRAPIGPGWRAGGWTSRQLALRSTHCPSGRSRSELGVLASPQPLRNKQTNLPSAFRRSCRASVCVPFGRGSTHDNVMRRLCLLSGIGWSPKCEEGTLESTGPCRRRHEEDLLPRKPWLGLFLPTSTSNL